MWASKLDPHPLIWWSFHSQVALSLSPHDQEKEGGRSEMQLQSRVGGRETKICNTWAEFSITFMSELLRAMKPLDTHLPLVLYINNDHSISLGQK